MQVDAPEARHLEHLRVSVQLPFTNVRLILVNNFIDTNYTALTGVADWLSVKDINVTVNTGLPTN